MLNYLVQFYKELKSILHYFYYLYTIRFKLHSYADIIIFKPKFIFWFNLPITTIPS